MLSRSVRVLTASAVTVAAAVAVSAPVTAAPAKKSSFADREVSKTTGDGWRVTAVKANERITSVPPLNQARTTREAFLSLRGEGRIDGRAGQPVNAGVVATGFHVGCNTSFDSVTVGGSAGPTAQLSVSYPPAVVVGAQAMGNISASFRPGSIVDIPFGTKQMAGDKAGIELDGVHVKVDGCVGPVAVRAYTRVAISTAANDTTVHVYGKPHKL